MLEIDAVPLLSDNYAWLLTSRSSATVAIVDPGEAAPVVSRLASLGLTLTHVLLTHHHPDHTGGVPELVARYPGVEVVASERDAKKAGATRAVRDGERVLDGALEVLQTPGHTLGAVSYYSAAVGAVFTGDTLFLAGCGRLFEGTPAMMWSSLQRLRALPAATRVYCGHEYTEKNLTFAARELGDAAVHSRLARVRAVRAQGGCTVPALLSEERATNPFLRADEPAVMTALGAPTPLDAFTELRRRRDGF